MLLTLGPPSASLAASRCLFHAQAVIWWRSGLFIPESWCWSMPRLRLCLETPTGACARLSRCEWPGRPSSLSLPPRPLAALDSEVACAHCLRVATEQLLMCGGCRRSCFCSQACVDADARVHALECPLLAAFARLEIEGETQAMRLALRLAAQKVAHSTHRRRPHVSAARIRLTGFCRPPAGCSGRWGEHGAAPVAGVRADAGAPR